MRAEVICGECWIDRDEPFGCACESLLADQATREETLRNGRSQDDGSRGAGDGAEDLAGSVGGVGAGAETH